MVANTDQIWVMLLMIATLLLTVLGSVLVICTVLRTAQLRTPTNYFMISLAVSDLLTALVTDILKVSGIKVHRT